MFRNYLLFDVVFFSFPDELILFKKRQSTTVDIAEKVSLAMLFYRSFRLLAS